MKVWVVMLEIQYEGGSFMGAFSTPEKAREWVAQLEAKRPQHFYEFDVLEIEMDNPEKPYFWH